MNTIYPCPPECMPPRSPVGLTFYGVLRDGGGLKDIDDDLGVTPLVRLRVTLAFSLGARKDDMVPHDGVESHPHGGPGAFRIIRDLYWEWYWTKYYPTWHGRTIDYSEYVLVEDL